MANPTTCPTTAFASDPACVAVMTNYCSTDTFLGQTYTQKWQGDEVTSSCRKYTGLNVGHQSQYVPVVDAYVRRYLITEGKPITFAQQGSLVYDPAIEDLIQVCQDYPGGCDQVLGQVCAGYTREDLKSNPNLGKLCGCFMSDNEYDTYGGTFGIQKICDPACVLQSAVKPKDPADQFGTLKCQQSICVIDDVTISILGQSNVGDINFTQACSTCTGGAGCICNISDISITAVESSVKDINFSQQCGSLRCWESDANGVPQQIDCALVGGDTTTNNGGGTSSTSFLSNSLLLTIIGIILGVIIIIIILFLIFRRRQEEPSRFRMGEQYMSPPPPAYGYQGGIGYNVYGSPIQQAPLI